MKAAVRAVFKPPSSAALHSQTTSGGHAAHSEQQHDRQDRADALFVATRACGERRLESNRVQGERPWSGRGIDACPRDARVGTSPQAKNGHRHMFSRTPVQAGHRPRYICSFSCSRSVLRQISLPTIISTVPSLVTIREPSFIWTTRPLSSRCDILPSL